MWMKDIGKLIIDELLNGLLQSMVVGKRIGTMRHFWTQIKPKGAFPLFLVMVVVVVVVVMVRIRLVATFTIYLLPLKMYGDY